MSASTVERVYFSDPTRPRVEPMLHGPVDEPAYLEVCMSRAWACQVMGPAMDHIRQHGTTGEKRIAGAAAFEDARRRMWAENRGLPWK